MKKYKDIFSRNEGVFSIMKNDTPLLYSDLFGEQLPKDLDSFAYFLASEKPVVQSLNVDRARSVVKETRSVIKEIYTQYSDNWVNIKKALLSEYDITGSKIHETLTGSDSSIQLNQTIHTDRNKGFDSTDFVDTDQSKKSFDDSHNKDYNHEKVVTKQSDAPQKAIQRELSLRSQKTLFNRVLNDIINNITLAIYE